jgi:tripartite-type tricarboxylate transporter receptor subunit TctC
MPRLISPQELTICLSAWLSPQTASVLNRLNREVTRILKDQAFIDKIAAPSTTPMTTTPTELRTFVAVDVARWVKVAHESRVQAD